MSTPVPVTVRAPSARPAAVAASARCYLAAAALAVVYAVAVFSQVGLIADAEHQSEVAHLDTASDVVEIAGSFALLGVAGLIFAGLLARCAFTVGHGRYGSRGAAWGITAFAVICLACNLTITGTGANRQPFDPVRANVPDALPQWYVVTALALQAVVIVLILTGAGLLTRPAAASYAAPPGMREQ